MKKARLETIGYIVAALAIGGWIAFSLVSGVRAESTLETLGSSLVAAAGLLLLRYLFRMGGSHDAPEVEASGEVDQPRSEATVSPPMSRAAMIDRLEQMVDDPTRSLTQREQARLRLDALRRR